MGDSLSSVSDVKIDGCQRVQDLLNNNDKDYLIQLGHFLDFHNEITNIPVDSFIRRYISDFESLRKEDKDFLTIPVKNKVKEIILTVANDTQKNGKPYLINHLINEFSSFVNTSKADLLKEVKNIVNQEFSNLDNLDDLNTAYETEMISEEQYFNQFKNITKDYSINLLLNLISRNDNKCLLVQEYLITKVFSLYDVSDIEGYKYVSLDYGCITNLKDLFKWINDNVKYNHIDIELWKYKEKQLTEKLTKEERWSLFEEGIINNPLLDNIREQLDKAYKKNSLKQELFNKECFQDVLAEDVINETNNDKIFMILDRLDFNHMNQAKDKANEQLNFFIWAYSPDENVDWEKISNYFYLLPYKKQIRLFRYLFYLKATGKTSFSVSELSERLTKNNHKLCIHLQLVLLFLTKKSENLNTQISSYEIEEILGKPSKDITEMVFYRVNLSSYFTDFFYECIGHLLLSYDECDREYYSLNGEIHKIKKDSQTFFVISFYDSPKDINGDYVPYLGYGDIDACIDILKRNIPCKLENGEYWISEIHESDVKDFCIDNYIEDCCDLFNDKFSFLPIHTNPNVRYNDSRNVVCGRNKNYRSQDPLHKIPFCWCDKKPCTRRWLFLKPIDEWEKYKFVDLLSISHNCNIEINNLIWDINAELSNFINRYNNSLENNTDVIEQEQVGKWTKEMDITTNISPYYDEDDDYSDSDDDYSPRERPSYGKYAGTYAQDEMGLSDDDIDTIYEGDPNAAWNND